MKLLVLLSLFFLITSCTKENTNKSISNNDNCGKIAAIKLLSITPPHLYHYETVVKLHNHHLSNIFYLDSDTIIKIGDIFCL